jgi:valyl-tRNA synthetase
MLCEFPSAAGIEADTQAEEEMRWVIAFIEGVRQIRGELDITPGRRLDVLLQNASSRDTEFLDRNLPYLMRLACVEVPRTLGPAQAAPISAVAFVGTLEILVPMAGLIDPSAELARLSKQQNKAQIDLKKMESKLSNIEFTRNAPAEVVAKDQQRLSELRTEVCQLAAQIARVTALKSQ